MASSQHPTPGHGKRSQASILLAAFGCAAVARWRCPLEPVMQLPAEPWRSPETSLRDYSFLHYRLQEEHYWSAAHAAGAISEYLRFMQLLAEAPKMELIASSDIDLVWHEHILDSANYAQDSLHLWGRFLHHRRARSAKEFSEIPASYERTKLVYAERYGAAPAPTYWGATTEASSMCGGGSVVDPNDKGPVEGGADSTNGTGGVDATSISPSKNASSSDATSSRLSFVLMPLSLSAASFAGVV
jgi:hypothetical protein